MYNNNQIVTWLYNSFALGKSYNTVQIRIRINLVYKYIACVASARDKRKDIRCSALAKNGAGPKRGTRGEGRGSVSLLPLPLSPLSFFWPSHHFSRGQNTENPVPLSFSASQPHGNARYAG